MPAEWFGGRNALAFLAWQLHEAERMIRSLPGSITEKKENTMRFGSNPLALVVMGCIAGAWSATALAQQPSSFTVYAQGLNAPRGLAFDPDGYLYVAEAGMGGSNKTDPKTCLQVPAPVGPYGGGSTGRISKVSPSHAVTTVASGFPSAQDALGDLIGVADVKFADGTLYALIAAGGCEHGNPDAKSGVAQVDRSTGKWTLIADISAFLKSHPAKFTAADDFESDGTLYSMIVVRGALVAVEPNHGQVLSIDRRGGGIKQLIDVSAFEGHIVPTSIAERNDTFYVGNLNLFPIDPDWARVLTISKGGAPDESCSSTSPRAGSRVATASERMGSAVAAREAARHHQ